MRLLCSLLLLAALMFNALVPTCQHCGEWACWEKVMTDEEKDSEKNDDCKKEDSKEESNISSRLLSFHLRGINTTKKQEQFANPSYYLGLHHPYVPELPPEA